MKISELPPAERAAFEAECKARSDWWEYVETPRRMKAAKEYERLQDEKYEYHKAGGDCDWDYELCGTMENGDWNQ